jgi:hypothetical protein
MIPWTWINISSRRYTNGKHMKWCSKSLTTKEMKIKPQEDVIVHLLGWPLLKHQKIMRWKGFRENGTLCSLGRNVKWHGHYRKQDRGSQKVKTELSYNPATPLLGIYTKELQAGLPRHMCIHTHDIIHNSQEMAVARMSIIRWMNKENLLHKGNGVLYNLKMKRILSHATIWTNLEDTLNKINICPSLKN